MTDNRQAGLRARRFALLIPPLLIFSLVAATVSASPQAPGNQEALPTTREASTRNTATKGTAAREAAVGKAPAREAGGGAREGIPRARDARAGDAEEEGRATHGSEPATWLLLATGLAIILLFHRQRIRLHRRGHGRQGHGHGQSKGRSRGPGQQHPSPVVPPAGR